MKKEYFLLFFIVVFSTKFYAQNILGIDVSNYQGSINWTSVLNDGKTFAFVKATEGYTYNDPRFVTNMNNGNNAGVVMGAYHFARPDNNSANDEANHFVSIAGNYIGNGYLPPVLDIEISGNYTFSQLSVWIQDWLTSVENQTGVRPIIYTTIYYASHLSSSLSTYDLWVADPDGSPNSNPPTGNWSDWVFKQYSSTGSVSGISGNVDLNVFNGDINDFNNLIGGGSSTPVNDECSDAITLQSNLNCNYTSGTVDGATPDNSFADASCDNYQYNSLAAGVFYKFTAVSNSHTIFVDPVGDLDPVVALYEGNDCYNLTEIDCADIGGGNGQSETINATNLSIGQTYWIRIYDWGNLPPSNGNFNICITHTNTGLPDIIVENESVNPTSVIAGNSINVSCRIRNDSNYDATNSGRVGYYLSTNATYDNSDIFLGNNYFGTLYANDYSDENSNLVIPSNTQTGNYYILFYADYEENIDEEIEYNNIEPVSLTVTNTSSLTYVPDDNFEQALIDLGYDDVLDNYVLTSNISGITTLNVSNRNISDLTGIEDFSSLWGLVASNNNISSVNLVQNTNLTEIYFNENNLSNINVSNNPLLQTLKCNNNYISYLDISSNSNLEFLAIMNNNLSNLDLSNNLAITNLYIGGNNITTLDLSNFTHLVALNCSSNNLSFLNLKNNNNQILANVWATNNPNLNCIQVDDENSANNGTGIYSNWQVDSGVSYSEDCALGIDSDILYQNISIYPNPTTGVFYIDNPKNIKLNNYVVTNSLGQEIKKGKLIDSKINLSNLNSGIYFVKLQNEKNEKITFKIIKQ